MFVSMCAIQEEMIFQIPWKHAAKHGWDINKDACLFRSWAIHTGVCPGLQAWGAGAGRRQGESLLLTQRPFIGVSEFPEMVYRIWE